MVTRTLSLGMFRIGGALLLAASLAGISACEFLDSAVPIDDNDLGGIVTGPEGPEAGVWVIAETTDLPTKFVKIVVTDDEGQYVLPDLPDANYDVWVRGYGLVDSPKVQAGPGEIVNLTSVVAPTAEAAAEYYPANYWYALMEVPPESEFPGTGINGNGISEGMVSQAHFVRYTKTDGCIACHQLGNKATRTFPDGMLESFDSVADAWSRRVQSGQAGAGMSNRISQMGREATLAMFADWTDRIAAGELPEEAPPRPQGLERNVVITQWDWADPKAYLHDEISTDKRNPTVNANGPIYGALEASNDYLPVIDPVTHTARQVALPVRDPNTPLAGSRTMPAPSPYWGDELIWGSQGNAHSFAMDAQERVWTASRIRPPETPAFCREGSDHPSATLFPIERSNRQVSYYDPATGETTLVNLCFGTHHLNFAEDENDTLWFCGGGEVIGWLNTKMLDETGDEEMSQGWTALILDTNANGRRDEDYVEPDEPIDPTKDKRLPQALYGVSPSPVDGSIWGSVTGFPGAVLRLDPGDNPPATALAEIYEVPWDDPAAPVQGYSPRGMDVDRNGVVWTVLSSGHMASFDRNKCTGPLNGPTATGRHCPEGWTLYQSPGPNLRGVGHAGSADSLYYGWVDQFDTLGLGENVPLATGNLSDSLLALLPESEEWVVMRLPYPMGFYSKGMDGRIDDSGSVGTTSGWKGRGVFSTFATRAPFHVEGGKGTTSKVVKFQVRPNPLAK